MRRALASVLSIGLLAGAAAAQPGEEEVLARRVLTKLQSRSFAEGIEYCGVIGRDLQGRLAASEPTPGTIDACTYTVPWFMEAVASYHTHGGHAKGYHSELPSIADLDSDAALGVDGWIATPGGRLWHVEQGATLVRQACPAGCLPGAPGRPLGIPGPVAKAYTRDGLTARLGL